MLIQTTELAIAVLTHLAGDARSAPQTGQQLAAALGSSPTYTRKVLQLLNRKGLTQIRRGWGPELARPAGEITLREVVEICQGEVLGECSGCAEREVCEADCAFGELRRSIRESLANWTIADLADGNRHRASGCCLQSIVSFGRPHVMPLTPFPIGEVS